MKAKLVSAASFVLAAFVIETVGCAAQESPTNRSTTMTASTAVKPSTEERAPDPAALTPAPVRNRVQIELHASRAEVWALLGDFAKLPDYSAGLERVDVKKDARGIPEDYTCTFKPMEPGGKGAVARDLVRWYAAGRGWASTDTVPNDFGTKNSLHLVTLDGADSVTRVTWQAHYDADDLAMNKSELDKALADIADRLIARFGGKLLERYVEPGG